MTTRAPTSSLNKPLGFTLLELVLVLFLIGLLASAGLLFTQNIEDQAQFDETQRRLELIRKAIIQAGDRTVNGQPELTGFVVDNGRLPYCLAELTGPELAFLPTIAVSGAAFYPSPCSSNTNLLLPVANTSPEGIRYGWQGPYIQVPAADSRPGSFAGFNRPFRDGYNNDLLIEDFPTLNYGWIWTLAASQTAPPFDAGDLIDIYDSAYDPETDPAPAYLTVQSLGYDPVLDSDNTPLDAINDFLVRSDDWLYSGGFAVQFVNTSAVSAIENWDQINPDEWQFTLTKNISGVPAQIDAVDISFTPATSSLSPGEMQQYAVDLGMDPAPVPVGYYRVEVRCVDIDGDCPEMASQPFTISILPRQQIAPIRWNIQPQ